jgi:hypothetical protein
MKQAAILTGAEALSPHFGARGLYCGGISRTCSPLQVSGSTLSLSEQRYGESGVLR